MISVHATTRVAPEKADFRPALSSSLFAGFLPEKTMATYWEKLKDPRWQRRRLEVMDRASFKCEVCGDGESTLNVHHKLYRKGADPWDYPDEHLQCLCEPCHETEHEDRQLLSRIVAMADAGQQPLQTAIALIGGFFNVRPSNADPEITDAYHRNPTVFELGLAARVMFTLGPDYWGPMIRKFVRENRDATPAMRVLVAEHEEFIKKSGSP